MYEYRVLYSYVNGCYYVYKAKMTFTTKHLVFLAFEYACFTVHKSGSFSATTVVLHRV